MHMNHSAHSPGAPALPEHDLEEVFDEQDTQQLIEALCNCVRPSSKPWGSSERKDGVRVHANLNRVISVFPRSMGF